MKARLLPAWDTLTELFDYDPETGNLFAKVRLSKKTLAGHLLCCKNKKGYVHFNLDGKFYYAHRVIWKLQTMQEPNIIDHINGIKWDNRIENLRSVTSSQNNLNHQDALGYWLNKKLKNRPFVAEIQNLYLGAFSTENEARRAYLVKRKELIGF